MSVLSRNPLVPTLLFLLLTVGGGLVIGSVTMPDGWFAALNKPAFQPPNWVFGPVWTLLYILIGIAGARIFTVARSSMAMKLWIAQMVLNFLWSPTFFAAHALVPAFVVIVLMLATIVAFIRAAWPIDRPAALMFLPYLAWVSFATVLNGTIAWIN